MTVIAYGIKEAAEAVNVDEATIRKAIHATDPTSYPPPLRAKRKGKRGSKKFTYSIPVKELERWHDSLPDA